MERHYKIASFIARMLDTQFQIGGFRFGLDPLLNLIPGFGSFLGFLFSFYIVWIAQGMGVSSHNLSKMVVNIGLDFLMGLIPVVGWVGDFVFKANIKNLAILKEHIEKQARIIDGEIVE